MFSEKVAPGVRGPCCTLAKNAGQSFSLPDDLIGDFVPCTSLCPEEQAF